MFIVFLNCLLKMKQLLILISIIIFTTSCFCQNVGILWSKQFGGNGNDLIYKVIQLSDGGVLTFGNSSSTNIFSGHGQTDVWVTRMDNRGKMLWQKALGSSGADVFADAVLNTNGTFMVLVQMQVDPSNHNYLLVKMNLYGDVMFQQSYGGSGNNIAGKLLKVSSDLYLIAGHSNAGDLPSFHGGTDIYVIEVRDSANAPRTQWQMTIGGTSYETLKDAQVDGSDVLLMGEADAGGGNITNYHAGADILVAKISAAGNLLWSKAYGGGGNDFPSSFIVSNDGNYLFAGNTSSYDGDVTGDHGAQDVWAVKLDPSGNILWQKSYGGSNTEDAQTIVQSSDGNVYIAAVTASVDGNVSGSHNALVNDLWILKLDNAGGSLIWQKCAGGTNYESYLYQGESVLTKRKAMIADSDGGCVVTGYTNSVNGDVSGLHGTTAYQDVWVIKLSGGGNLLWQKCLGGSAKDFVGDFIQTGVNKYSVLIYSNSSDGDLNGTLGGQDALFVKLGSINQIKGSVFVDLNGDNVKDASEPLYPLDLDIQFTKNGDTSLVLTSNGNFSFNADTGTFKTEVLPPGNFGLTPASTTSTFSNYFNKDSFSFALTLPAFSVKDLMVQVIPLTPARPGFPFSFRIAYANMGTDTIQNVILKLGKGYWLNISSTNPNFTSTIADSVYWNLGTVNPFEGFKYINGSAIVSANAFIGSNIQLLASIIYPQTDAMPQNNYDTALVRVTSAYDPNDKQETHAGSITPAQVQSAKPLRYTVRLQNTGTDTAFNAVVKDTLDSFVNPSTVQMLASSHSYTMTIENGNIITWAFDNINLPDSNHNELLSHGFVSYIVQPNQSLIAGQQIHNTASIYFDYNLPVKTNDALTIVQDNSVILPVQLTKFEGQLYDGDAHLNWSATIDASFNRFEIERCFDAIGFTSIGAVKYAGQKDYSFIDDLKTIATAVIYYRLKMIDLDGSYKYSPVIKLEINSKRTTLDIYPNPFNAYLFLSYISEKDANVSISIIDASGRTLVSERKRVNKGRNQFEINELAADFLPGLYLIRINGASGSQSKWAIKTRL